MKSYVRHTLIAACLTCLLAVPVFAQAAPAGYVDFGQFSPSDTGEFVEVNIKSNLINLVARLAAKAEPEAAEVLRSLQHLRVNVIGLNDKNRQEVSEKITRIRGALDEKGWERIVAVQKKNEDVTVFLKIRADQAIEGLFISVLQGTREAVLINIVGDIKPEKIAMIGERFNIEPLKKVAETLETK